MHSLKAVLTTRVMLLFRQKFEGSPSGPLQLGPEMVVEPLDRHLPASGHSSSGSCTRKRPEVILTRHIQGNDKLYRNHVTLKSKQKSDEINYIFRSLSVKPFH